MAKRKTKKVVMYAVVWIEKGVTYYLRDTPIPIPAPGWSPKLSGLIKTFLSVEEAESFIRSFAKFWAPAKEDELSVWSFVEGEMELKEQVHVIDYYSEPIKDVIEDEKDHDDPVNHPSYYGGKDNPYEVIKVIEAWKLDFHLGTAVKYIPRAGIKDPDKEIEDLEKSVWYLQRKIDLLKAARLGLTLEEYIEYTLSSYAIEDLGDFHEEDFTYLSDAAAEDDADSRPG